MILYRVGQTALVVAQSNVILRIFSLSLHPTEYSFGRLNPGCRFANKIAKLLKFPCQYLVAVSARHENWNEVSVVGFHSRQDMDQRHVVARFHPPIVHEQTNDGHSRKGDTLNHISTHANSLSGKWQSAANHVSVRRLAPHHSRHC